MEADAGAEVHAGVLRCTVEHRLEFEEIRDLMAYLWRERPASKCKGLSRSQVNTLIAPALSRGGRRALREARQACQDGEVPEHLRDFLSAQLRLLYPGLDKRAAQEEQAD